LKPEAFQESYLRQAALGGMMKFQDRRLPTDSALHLPGRREMEHQRPHPIPIRDCDLDDVAVMDALKVVDEIRILRAELVELRNSNFGLPYHEWGNLPGCKLRAKGATLITDTLDVLVKSILEDLLECRRAPLVHCPDNRQSSLGVKIWHLLLLEDYIDVV
jgi:hypothetical protein